MAVCRLRQAVVSRVPSLIRARPFSTCRSLSRLAGVHNFLLEGSGSGNRLLLRNVSLHMIGGIHDSSLMLKLHSGARFFSSNEIPSHTVVEMPALSPTMNQGNIAKWRKKEGDKIEVGDVICEIETDKATLEFESLEEGYLAKILVPEGSKDVPVGQPIAVTVEDQDGIKNLPSNLSSGSDLKEEESTNQNLGTEATSTDLPPHQVVEMPALSPTMNHGNITKWRKKEGDKIEVGDVICEIETDKATLEFESLEEGYLAKILAPEGSKDVAVGQPIAITVEDAGDIKNISSSSISSGSEAKEGKSTPQSVDKPEITDKTGFSRISPAAKLLIKEFRLDASSLRASGPHGTLLKGDVLAAMKSGKGLKKAAHSPPEKKSASPTSPSKSSQSPPSSKSISHSHQIDNHEDLPNSQIRRVIAKRLLESKQSIPHLYLSSDVILDPLLAFRKELKEKHDFKVSVNDIVIKAVAVALKNTPEANAYWNAEKEEVTLHDSVDISIAVATEKGLMTPIVRNADQKSISSISSEVKELAEKARAGKLAPNEFQGGTFSISNLGMFPVDQFCAIINPPQACILAVGRGNKVVEPVLGIDGKEVVAVVNKMSLTLSADNRVFDEKVGSSFLTALRLNFSDIRRLLL
ncbi:hypothetical protein Scep_005336 [Stephania cephalantha]|uniref:Dihydrolipoamide acetyltransferase component of pyruvate dehydrogenase complex n=1 Tax=Stephania cephalantha TaxID=152367 RepID=A0AAP0KVU7_9MAGN